MHIIGQDTNMWWQDGFIWAFFVQQDNNALWTRRLMEWKHGTNIYQWSLITLSLYTTCSEEHRSFCSMFTIQWSAPHWLDGSTLCVSLRWRQWQAITEIDSRVTTAIWVLDLRHWISRDEAIPATLSCPGPVVTVIERRCIYKVPCSATPLIPVNLKGELKEKMSKPKDTTRS